MRRPASPSWLTAVAAMGLSLPGVFRRGRHRASSSPPKARIALSSLLDDAGPAAGDLRFETVELERPGRRRLRGAGPRPARRSLALILTLSLGTMIGLPGALLLSQDPVNAGELPALAADIAAEPTTGGDAPPLDLPARQAPGETRDESSPGPAAPRANAGDSSTQHWAAISGSAGARGDEPARSPIFAGLDTGSSGIASDVLAAESRPVPVRITIPAMGLRASVTSAGVDRRTRELAVPRNAEDVVWYQHGSAPGEAGSAVLAAHVDFNGLAGAFWRLRELEPGDRIVVGMSDGQKTRFEVVARRKYERNRLPNERIFSSTGPSTLTLVTCGGRFQSDEGRYASNIVVFAVPIGPS